MKRTMKNLLALLRGFFIFLFTISFVVTCSFLLFFSKIELTENEIREFAPIVFLNVVLLAVLLTAIDYFRRRLVIGRAVKKIKGVLQRLSSGDFTARLSPSDLSGAGYDFYEIAEGINLLAGELSGVETLRSDFIANVSHELKTPLAVMNNYGTLLSRPGVTEDERIEYARAISESSRRLAGLVTNILKLNKLENQQIFPRSEEYDLGEQICECLLSFENEIEKKALEIETDIEEGVKISSDPELLSIVWSNLFSNAIKFTDNGGRIFAGLKTEGEYLVVTVRDSGCGMTSEVGEHIFEKFYQGDSSHASQGNGLGLALVKKVVDIFRGEISVESAPGEGTAFAVKFRRE